MAIKIPQEYLGYDFGFTGVDEHEIKQDVLQELDAKDQALTEKELELQNKIKVLELQKSESSLEEVFQTLTGGKK